MWLQRRHRSAEVRMNPDFGCPAPDCPGPERWRCDRPFSDTVWVLGPWPPPIASWRPPAPRNPFPEIHAAKTFRSSLGRSGGSVLSEHSNKSFGFDGTILAKMKVCSARFSGRSSRYWAWQPTSLCRFGGGCWRPSQLAIFPGGSPTAATGFSCHAVRGARHFLALQLANRVPG